MPNSTVTDLIAALAVAGQPVSFGAGSGDLRAPPELRCVPGETVRLGTVRLILAATVDGPPVIARCDGCEPGDPVALDLTDGALRARPRPA